MSAIQAQNTIKKISNDISLIEKALAAQERGATLISGFSVYAARYHEITKCLEQIGTLQANLNGMGYEELKARVSSLSSRIAKSSALEFPQELQFALRHNNSTVAQQILKQSSLLNTPLPNGELPLYYAIRSGSYETVERILEDALVDPLLPDHQKLTLIDHLFLSGDIKMMALCLGKLLVNQSLPEEMIRSYLHTPEKKIAEAIGQVKPIGMLSPAELPALHQAAYMGDQSFFNSIPMGSRELNTPIRIPPHLAARAEGLLTPLHLAILGKHKPIVDLLLDKKVDPWRLTSSGKNSLHLAVMIGDYDLVERMLDYPGCRVNLADKAGNTALHYAVLLGNLKMVRLLVERGGNLLNKVKGVTLLEILVSKFQKSASLRDPLSFNFELGIRLGLQAGALGIDAVTSYLNGSEEMALNQDYLYGTVLTRCQQVLENAAFVLPLLNITAPSRLPVNIPFSQVFQKKADWQSYGGCMVNSFKGVLLNSLTSSFPPLRALAHPARIYYNGQEAYEGIKACWQNRHYEVIRPLLRGGMHLLDLGGSILWGYRDIWNLLYGPRQLPSGSSPWLSEKQKKGAEMVQKCFDGDTPPECASKKDILSCCLQSKAEALAESWEGVEPSLHPEHAKNVLGLPPGATPEEIQKRFRKMSLALFPDKCQEFKKTCDTLYKGISAAYKKLTP